MHYSVLLAGGVGATDPQLICGAADHRGCWLSGMAQSVCEPQLMAVVVRVQCADAGEWGVLTLCSVWVWKCGGGQRLLGPVSARRTDRS